MADADQTPGIKIRLDDINFNTIICIVGLVLTFYVTVNNRFNELAGRQDAHAASISTTIELYRQRLDTLNERDADFLKAIKELRDALDRQRDNHNQLSSDVRLVLQLIQQKDLLPEGGPLGFERGGP